MKDEPTTSLPRSVSHSATRIAVLYAVFGLIWIYGSDALMAVLAPSVHDLLLVSAAKGALYVIVTAAGLFVLVRRGTARERSAFTARVRSEARFRAQYEAMPVPTLTWRIEDERLLLLDRNVAAQPLLATVPANAPLEARELFWSAPLTLDAIVTCARQQTTALATERLAMPGEAEPRWRQSHAAWVAPDLVLHHLLDIHEQEKAREERARVQEELQRTAGLLDTFFEQAPIGFAFLDLELRCVRANRKLAEVTGLAADRLGRTVSDLLPGLDASIVEDIRAVAETRKAYSREFTFRMPFRAGPTALWLGAFPVVTGAGEAIGVGVVVSDLSDRARAEEALRQSENRFRLMVEGSEQVFYYVHDHDGILQYLSPSVRPVLGYAPDELVGRSFYATVPPGEDAEVRERTVRALETGETSPPYTILNRHRAGHLITLELTESPLLENGAVVGMQGFARDVTQRRRLEDDLRQAQKMEAIGRLAGGIAHDFNNILTVISGSTHVALELAADNPQLLRLLGEIHSAADRAAGLTRQLLAFSRKQVVQPRALDLNAVLTGTERILRRLIGEDVSLTVDRSPDLPTTWADPGQMEQVLLNLVVNARDAMPAGGALRISTRELTVEDPPEHVRPGRFVVLEVTDTGIGIAPELLTRIFEPFFTTKPMGSGTGLGLSTVYGIVHQAGGWVDVESVPGSGSVFRAYLPVYDGSPAASAAQLSRIDPRRGSERILVVEDEAAVRRLVRVVLQRYGYEILEASDGREAIRIVLEQREPLDLILSDVVMPGMSGPELIEQCRTLCPDTKLVLMSGYAGDRLAGEEAGSGRVLVLEKPFEPSELARVVRAILDGAANVASTDAPLL